MVLLISLFGSIAAFADSETFTIYNLTGPLAGNTYSGSFTWDSSVDNSLTSLSFDFPGWTGTLTDLEFPPYVVGPGIEAFYAPGPIGNSDAFAFFGNDTLAGYPYTFAYGTTTIVDGSFNGDGIGSVSYSAAPVPEPGIVTLLAGGLLSLAVRRKLHF
jgi:hypothetical protein